MLVNRFQERGVLAIGLFSSIINYSLNGLPIFGFSKWIVFGNAAFSGFGELSFAAISSLKSIYSSRQVRNK